MEVGVDTLHVLQRDPLLQNHLVKGANEECVQEAAVENGQTNDAANEFEVVEMLGVDAGVGVDLKGIVIVGRVLKQAVKGVEHLVRKEEKEFSGTVLVLLPKRAQ